MLLLTHVEPYIVSLKSKTFSAQDDGGPYNFLNEIHIKFTNFYYINNLFWQEENKLFSHLNQHLFISFFNCQKLFFCSIVKILLNI